MRQAPADDSTEASQNTGRPEERNLEIDLKQFQWEREPAAWKQEQDALLITTKPHTDLWQRTYYHFRNDNAPVFQMESADPYFSFTVHVDLTGANHRFDQGGIVMYLDSENWLKASVEYEDGIRAHLGSVVTSGGYSDWATTEISADITEMWYRLSRREDDFRIENSLDGQQFSQMRICHLEKAKGPVRFGVYACSPEDSPFTARFTDFTLTNCVWQAHDGQQPDEE